jgi:hypothetical protein
MKRMPVRNNGALITLYGTSAIKRRDALQFNICKGYNRHISELHQHVKQGGTHVALVSPTLAITRHDNGENNEHPQTSWCCRLGADRLLRIR